MPYLSCWISRAATISANPMGVAGWMLSPINRLSSTSEANGEIKIRLLMGAVLVAWRRAISQSTKPKPISNSPT
ncbi:hypothetical protein D1872_348190 [compost metagenome]